MSSAQDRYRGRSRARRSPPAAALAGLTHAALRCGGRMVVLATIDDPAVIRRILTHLGLPMEPGKAAPGRTPPERAELDGN
jgi:hypothetical protein